MSKIAVVGISTFFSGASTPAEFWQNLVDNRDGTSDATVEQMGVDPELFFASDANAKDKYYCMRGGYIRDAVLDPEQLGVSAEAFGGLDDLNKWSLYVAHEALRDSGYLDDAERLRRCGIILGNLSFPTKSSNQLFVPIYHQVLNKAIVELTGDESFVLPRFSEGRAVTREAGLIAGYPAGLIGDTFGLKGVRFALDAACASSLYSTKLACDYLSTGAADLMLAGAVSAADPMFVNMGFSIFQAYPENGISAPLDTRSEGLFAGEGAGMLVLKRYDDAVRDGDTIHATILGGGLSNDGKGQFVLSPNTRGQVTCFERAYENAGVDPKSVDYVECHATGTPLGDKVELTSMETFFGAGDDASVPLLGSVKSNLGHMLTAAGMPGMTKVIEAMKHDLIPATIKVEAPQASPGNQFSGKQIVSENQAWPASGDESPKRAGVSVFGFGGCNAHVIFEEAKDVDASPDVSEPATAGSMAIVGMDTYFGGCDGLSAFNRSIFDGEQHFGPLPEKRWKGLEEDATVLEALGVSDRDEIQGAFIEDLDLDFLHFKIPPNKDDRLIPQQLMLLKVADRALQDAGFEPGGNVAVLVGMGIELDVHQFRGRVNLQAQFPEAWGNSSGTVAQSERDALETIVKDSIHGSAQLNQYTSLIGNIMAARVSSLWDFTGPAFTLSAEENSVFRSLEVAQLLFETSDVEAIVVAAVDLSGSMENVLLRQQFGQRNLGKYSISFESDSDGWQIGEGAAAIVLRRRSDAEECDERIYASLDGLSIQVGQDGAAVARACEAAMSQADIEVDAVEYVETHGGGFAEQDAAELSGLNQVYGGVGERNCALGSVKANIGHTFNASGLASVIKTALCLHNRYMPGVPGWQTAKPGSIDDTGAFYVPTESRTWLKNMGPTPRTAGVNCLSGDGTVGHLILSEVVSSVPANDYLHSQQIQLIPLVGASDVELLKRLDDVKADVIEGIPVESIARAAFDVAGAKSDARYAAVLLGDSEETLVREIALLESGIASAFAEGGDWQSPMGSCVSATPQGKDGKVSFVYTGAFNSYLNLSKDLFQLFPELHGYVEKHSDRLASLLGDRTFFPRTVDRPSDNELRQMSRELPEKPIDMFENGIGNAVCFTEIMRDLFKVEPDSAFGFSMGEISMMYALNVWDGPDAMSETLRSTPVFQTRLAGPMETLREAWDIPDDAPDGSFWTGFTLLAPADKVAEAIGDDPYVQLLLINTAFSTVIAGKPENCVKVIEKLGCDYFPAALGDVIHCDLVRADFDGLADLHRMPVRDTGDVDFYTAVGYQQLEIEIEGVAKNIAEMYCNPVDFPRLIETVYGEGNRVFLELGPRDLCTKAISATLHGREHAAVAFNRKGATDHASLLKALGQLFTHRVDMDLSRLYREPVQEKKRQLIQTVDLGGEPIRKLILTGENKARFGVKQPAPTPVPVKIETPAPVVTKNAPLPVAVLQETKRMKEPALMASPSWHKFEENRLRLNEVHATFLESRNESMRDAADLIALQLGSATLVPRDSIRSVAVVDVAPPLSALKPVVQAPVPVARPVVQQRPAKAKRHDVPVKRSERRDRIPGEIWDVVDLTEFAEGKIANIFGPEYAVIDDYRRRTRLPTTEYLLVTRVTELDAEMGTFEPCSMTTEYDIPKDAWYAVDGQIPWAVSVESGQCDLLLISYLGVDLDCKGDRVYRLLDCTLSFMDDIPMEGDTLRYEISINSFAKQGEKLLFFFSYDCYVGDVLKIKMTGGAAGFFTDEELDAGKGVIQTDEEIAERAKIVKTSFTPLLNCEKNAFDDNDMLQVCSGDWSGVFGTHYDQGALNRGLVFSTPKMLMIEQITQIDPTGGAWGLGLIVGEKTLDPEHWYFPCHFKNDEVMAGSLMSDGCGQLLRFYTMWLGMQTGTSNARFQPIPGDGQQVRCRGQVQPQHGTLTYRMEVTEIGMEPYPYAKANIDILLNGKIVVDFRNLGLYLKDGYGDDTTVAPIQLEESSAKPGIASHALAGVNGNRIPEYSPGLYPPRVPPFQPFAGNPLDVNTVTDTLPYTWYHFNEFSTGRVANCFGEEFAVYDDRTPPRTPAADLQLTTRVTNISGERRNFKKPAYVVAEFDVPEDAWFYMNNSVDSLMPYSIIMEIALQPCGFISAWMGTTLKFPDVDLFFRNLNGDGTLLKEIDLRGKTIVNTSTVTSTTASSNTIIQSFTFEMSVDGEPFYVGTAVFGYFVKDQLTHQLGLDNGEISRGWHLENDVPDDAIDLIVLESPESRVRYFEAPADKPHYCLAGPQLEFVDTVRIVENGGKTGQGYIYAERTVDVEDWFFACHFHQDPVMPGSLGVEAMFQILQVFALQQGFGDSMKNPRFNHVLDKISWKYRGQITTVNKQMSLDLHITKIEKTEGRVTLTADGNLSKDGLRIYELSNLIFCVEEST
ncbi:MAG: PfaB family protein [Candidatus Hydrogenedentota bacterium]